MKTSCYLLVGGCCAPLIMSAPAYAAFTGLSTESRPNEFGITVVSLYADFDQFGDQLTAIAGTPLSPLSISVIDGTFYQHPFGSDRAPVIGMVSSFPSLAYDTFVTIGVELLGPLGQPEDLSFTTPGWSGFGPDRLSSATEGWLVLPGAAQGNPYDANFVAGDGRTLIGQLATGDGIGFEGSVLVHYNSEGVAIASYASFTHVVPTPGTLALVGVSGLIAARRRRRGS